MNPIPHNHLVNVDIKLEALILGSCINQPQLVAVLLRYIKKPAVFYEQLHQQVFQVISDIHAQGEKIDLFILKDRLAKCYGGDSKEWFFKLDELTTNAYQAHIDNHCLILFQLAIKRFLGAYGQRLMMAASDPATDALQMLERVDTDIDAILSNIHAIKKKSIGDYLLQVFDELDAKKAGRQKGLTLGIPLVDERTGGFEPGNFVLIAAGTGMGKTGTVIHAIRHQCLVEKNTIGLFTLEMTGSEVLKRIIAAESNYSNSEINRGAVDIGILHRQVQHLETMPLVIHDRPVQSVELQYIIRDWVRQYKVKAVIIDYLQLIKDSRYKSAYDRVSNLSMDLKSLASELEIVIVALSQLSRDFEKRKGWDMRPRLSDLRESGQLEQDANAVLMLFRPYKYGLEYENGSMNEHTIEIHGLKFRSAKPTESNNPWLYDYDGACNRIVRFGSLPANSQFVQSFQSLESNNVNF